MNITMYPSHSGSLYRQFLLGLMGCWCLLTAQQLSAQDAAGKGAASARIQLQAVRGLATSQSMSRLLQGGGDIVDDVLRGMDKKEEVPREFQAVSLEFKDAASCQQSDFAGNKLITRFDRFAMIFVPQKYDLAKLKALPGFVWSEVEAEEIVPPPPRGVASKEKSRAVPEKIVQGGVGNITGKGVIIAIVDTGIDFHHPDFITKDASGQPVSRLQYFWDLTSDAYASGVGVKADYSYPNGASIGTVYDRATLTADLRGGKQQVREWDTNSHGTVCAGVAAGNGSAMPSYKGVAPDADLIAVRISDGNNHEPGVRFMYMVPAICEWLDKKATELKQPLVVSCSFGGTVGRHDGQNIEERHLSARFGLDRPGRGICVAAGNSGDQPMHAAVPIGPKSSAPKIEWEIDRPGYLQLYIQTDQDKDLGFEAAKDTKILERVDDYVHPLTNHIILSMVVGAGKGGFQLYSQSGAKYEADAYLNGGFRPNMGFTGESVSFSKQISAPGSALNVLTVGSFDWNDQFAMLGGSYTLLEGGKPLKIGGISSYSNPGPLRFGNVVKPEIVAPGEWYAAAAPRNVVPRYRENSGLYMEHNGTSAATPYAAGVVALMFQKKPTLTWGEARKAITASATSNSVTGTCPNPQWGHGKLDYAAVEKILASLK